MLQDISTLFDPAQSLTYETINKGPCKDIYFTEYAKGLLDHEGVWGLVAAPLGKRANISAFYNHVDVYKRQVVQENATGVRVVRAFGREQFEMERFDEKNDAFAKLWIRLGTLSGLYWGIGDPVSYTHLSVPQIWNSWPRT